MDCDSSKSSLTVSVLGSLAAQALIPSSRQFFSPLRHRRAVSSERALSMTESCSAILGVRFVQTTPEVPSSDEESFPSHRRDSSAVAAAIPRRPSVQDLVDHFERAASRRKMAIASLGADARTILRKLSGHAPPKFYAQESEKRPSFDIGPPPPAPEKAGYAKHRRSSSLTEALTLKAKAHVAAVATRKNSGTPRNLSFSTLVRAISSSRLAKTAGSRKNSVSALPPSGDSRRSSLVQTDERRPRVASRASRAVRVRARSAGGLSGRADSGADKSLLFLLQGESAVARSALNTLLAALSVSQASSSPARLFFASLGAGKRESMAQENSLRSPSSLSYLSKVSLVCRESLAFGV